MCYVRKDKTPFTIFTYLTEDVKFCPWNSTGFIRNTAPTIYLLSQRNSTRGITLTAAKNPAQSRISSNLTAQEDHQQNDGTRTIIGAWNWIFNPIPGRMENRYDQGLNRKNYCHPWRRDFTLHSYSERSRIATLKSQAWQSSRSTSCYSKSWFSTCLATIQRNVRKCTCNLTTTL